MDKMPYRKTRHIHVRERVPFVSRPENRRIQLGELTLPLKLQIEMNDVTTPSQIANAFKEINNFVSRLIGGVMASGDGKSNEPKIALALNGAAQLEQSGDMFAGTSNIAVPQLGPQAIPGRRQ